MGHKLISVSKLLNIRYMIHTHIIKFQTECLSSMKYGLGRVLSIVHFKVKIKNGKTQYDRELYNLGTF